jgi:hypothetical protein
MNQLRVRLTRLLIALGVVSALWACNAPFIPVPPPGQTSFSSEVVSDGAGGQKTVWITRGGPDDKAGLARFFIFDTNRGAGVITMAAADGSYVAPPMDGTMGDHVQLFYETPAGDDSAQVCLVLTDGATAPVCPP